MAFIILAALPWALYVRAFCHDRESNALVTCLCLSFSLGSLTLIMLCLGILGIPLRYWTITVIYLLLMAAGWRLAWRRRAAIVLRTFWPEGWVRRSIWLICAAVAMAQCFNAGYWPFFREDVLGIYAPFAATVVERQALISLSGLPDAMYRYESYPMMVPLSFAYVHMSANGINEYLAKTVVTLLSLACIPAAYLLGYASHSQKTGWLSAALLALTPAFWRWASAGYVDLPMAFFATMSAYFALRLWQSGHHRDALLSGIHLGMVTWVKNAGLILLPILTLWFFMGIRRGKIQLRHWVILVSSALVSGAIWYAWTFIQAGVIVPKTAWTDEAQHSLATLLVFISQWENYSLVGWLILLGMATVLWSSFQDGFRKPGHLLLLLIVIPYWLVWWWFVSYDSRFILLFLPIACVFGALIIDAAARAALPNLRSAMAAALLICAALWATHGILISIQFKDEILANPILSHEEKIAIVRPPAPES